MLGPIDYVVVGFKGNNFDGSILEELSKAAKSGVIRVVDVMFILKDADGNVVAGEIEDQPDELRAGFEEYTIDDFMPLVSEKDIEKVGESMDNDTAAGVIVIEQLWAKGLKKALIDAGGVLIDEGRIHPDTVLAAEEEIETTK